MKISITVDGLENAEAFRKKIAIIRKAGFEAIDLDLASKGMREIMNRPDAEKYAASALKLLKEEGVEIGQAHGPFNPYSFKYPEAAAETLKDMHTSIPFAAELGIKYVVAHPMRPREEEDPFFTNPSELRRRNFEMYASLVAEAKPLGVTLCTENMFSVKPYGQALYGYTAGIQDVVEQMDAAPGLCVCLDTGHAAITGQNIVDFVYAFGDRLKILHVHGNDLKKDLHLSPFEVGQYPWDEFCKALADVHYEGTMNLEAVHFMEFMPEEMLLPAYTYLAACARYLAVKTGL